MAAGIKEDIEAFINKSFSRLDIDDFLSKAVSGEEHIDVTKLVDIIITEAYTKGASDIFFESSALSGENRVFFWMDGVYREYMTVAEAVAFDVPKIQISVTTYPIEGLREEII